MTTPTAPAPTPEPAAGKPAEPAPPEPTGKGTDRLPDDHPLVTALASIKTELADTKGKLKTFEDANKSEVDKATEQAATEKDRADKAEARAARLAAAVKYSLTEDDLELLDGVSADKVDERARKLAERLGDRKKSGNYVPKEGTGAGESKPDDMREFTRQLFGAHD